MKYFFVKFKKFLRNSFLLSVLLTSKINYAYSDTLDTIISVLSALTCETQGVGDLLRTEFSHTCIPASFFTLAIATILSPGLYPDTLLKLKINDETLFPDSCLRKNRLDPNNPRLSFAFCNNAKLVEVRAVAIANSTIAIFKSAVTGDDPWNDIKDAWEGSKADYHTIYRDQGEGANGIELDAPLPLPWQVIRDNDRMCLATYNIFGQLMPVGCKYIKEPFPKSIYSSFMDNGTANTGFGKDEMALTTCSNAGGCYFKAYNNSKSPIVITGPLIGCMKEMVVRLLVSKDVCSFDDINLIVNSSMKETSSLFQFQKNMYRAVSALLTIYVIFFGFRIVLNPDSLKKQEIVNFVIKIIFVTYFSVGINVNYSNGSSYGRFDGMTQWVVPFLLGGMQELAGIIMNASPSDLCVFSPSDYSSHGQDLSLWDAVDCRLIHYLGLDALGSLISENQLQKSGWDNFDPLSNSIPPYFFLLLPAVITGNLALASIALMYPMLVIAVIGYMVSLTVSCFILITILTILAPIFVPMLLFEYTSQYFQGWMKLLLSFMLQPMVVVVFMVTMFSVYDKGFYGTCKYNYNEVTSGDRKVRLFTIDNDWSKYTDDEQKSCQLSIGYILNNPFLGIYNIGQEAISDTINGGLGSNFEDFGSYMKNFDILNALNSVGGMFFSFIEVIFELVRDLLFSMLIACLCLYLMYNLSEQLSEFAADMVEGVSLSAVTNSVQDTFKKGMSAINAAGGALKELSKNGGKASRPEPGVKGGEDSSGDGAAGGGGGATRSSGQIAGDSISSRASSSSMEKTSRRASEASAEDGAALGDAQIARNSVTSEKPAQDTRRSGVSSKIEPSSGANSKSKLDGEKK